MTKHTPGPWMIGHPHPNNACVYIVADGAKEIATLFGPMYGLPDAGGNFPPSPERDANAHLIAAAPELLDALKAAHKCLLIRDDPRSGKALKKVEDAIRHAEGQQ